MQQVTELNCTGSPRLSDIQLLYAPHFRTF